MHEALVNRLGGLSLPWKSVVRITDHPDMTLDVYRGCKTTIQQQKVKQVVYIILNFRVSRSTCIRSNFYQKTEMDSCSFKKQIAFSLEGLPFPVRKQEITLTPRNEHIPISLAAKHVYISYFYLIGLLCFLYLLAFFYF